MSGTVDLRPDHDLEARRRKVWTVHHATVARIARTAGAEMPWPERPSRSWLDASAARTRLIEGDMRSAAEGAEVRMIDALALAFRALERGEIERARDGLERLLDEIYPAWKAHCPW